MHRKTILSAALILFAALASGYAADKLVLKLAIEHQNATPQLAMAAAMGGLFAGGLVAVLGVLIAFRAGSSLR